MAVQGDLGVSAVMARGTSAAGAATLGESDFALQSVRDTSGYTSGKGEWKSGQVEVYTTRDSEASPLQVGVRAATDAHLRSVVIHTSGRVSPVLCSGPSEDIDLSSLCKGEC